MGKRVKNSQVYKEVAVHKDALSGFILFSQKDGICMDI